MTLYYIYYRAFNEFTARRSTHAALASEISIEYINA